MRKGWGAPAVGLLLMLSSCLPDPPSGPDLWDTLTDRQNLSTFVTALERSGIDESLKKGFIYTVFAPTNEAFDAWLSANGYASVNDIPRQQLIHLLWYHVQLGELDLSLDAEGYALTLSPASPDSNALVFQFRNDGNTVILNDSVRISTLNIQVRNGLINELNAVLSLPSAYDLLKNNGALSIMRETVDRAGLAGVLSSTDEFTILAPTNTILESFFDRNNIQDLDDLTDEEVKALARRHIIGENITFNEVINGPVLEKTTLGGTNVRLSSYRQGEMIVNDTIGVPVQDLQGTNGVLHILVKVIDPF